MSFHRAHQRIRTPVGTRSRTLQDHKDECDINNILRQYQKTGIITHVQAARPSYEDLPESLDYQLALNTLMEAETAFLALPSKVRDHFENDPAKFLASFQDEKQADQLRAFGLLKPKPDDREKPDLNRPKPDNDPGKPEKTGT